VIKEEVFMFISLWFWFGYLLIGTILYLIAVHRLENDSEFKNTIYADLFKANMNKIMMMIIIGWLPLFILAILNQNNIDG
jgi:hypothetical protein